MLTTVHLRRDRRKEQQQQLASYIAHPRSAGAARSAAPARVGRLSDQKQRKNTRMKHTAHHSTTPFHLVSI